MSHGCVQTQCFVQADEGAWSFLHGETVCTCAWGETPLKCKAFPAFGHPFSGLQEGWAPAETAQCHLLASSPCDGSEPSEVLGSRRKVCGGKVMCTLAFPRLLPALLTEFCRQRGGSGSGNTLLFHLMHGSGAVPSWGLLQPEWDSSVPLGSWIIHHHHQGSSSTAFQVKKGSVRKC